MSAGFFAKFYAPLIATSFLLTATNPLVAAALARTSDPAASLAGYGVAFALIGVLYAPLLVVQQVTAARLLEGGDIRPVKRFAYGMGVIMSGVAAAVAVLRHAVKRRRTSLRECGDIVCWARVVLLSRTLVIQTILQAAKVLIRRC